MIIYNSNLNPNLRDFGFDIPLENSRWEKTFQKLQEHGDQKSWHFLDSWEQVERSDLLLAHDQNYIDDLFSNPKPLILKAYEGDQYFKPSLVKKPLSQMLDRALGHVSGTLTACRTALSSGWAYFMGGGMHHALSFTGQGFCLLNDVVISLRMLQKKHHLQKALIIDVDVHKGDGISEITQSDSSLYTVSLHGSQTWPLVGGEYQESLIPCDCDRPIDDSGKYLQILEETLNQLPCDFDLALVVQGADPFEKDELPSSSGINLTLEEILQRDQLIHQWLSSHGLPQAYCMGGGYGAETWRVYTQYLSWVLKNDGQIK